jgi:hypothetical protein
MIKESERAVKVELSKLIQHAKENGGTVTLEYLESLR